jgi:hypothetical protein
VTERGGVKERIQGIREAGFEWQRIIGNRREQVHGGQQHFIRIDRMEIPDEEPVPVYLKDLRFLDC